LTKLRKYLKRVSKPPATIGVFDMNKDVYCENCDTYVPFTVKKKKIIHKLRGDRIKCMDTVGECNICGERVGYMLFLDENLETLYSAYRQKHNIIETGQIKEIPVKYAIGKRPLSILLGWGEQTLTRYCDGDMPSKQYGEVLRRIYDDSAYYISLLENNKDLVKPSTYRKSMAAAKKLVKEQGEDSNDRELVKRTLEIPQWLDEQAERAGVNFSAVFQEALKAAL
jgi:hypothetical protein